MNDVEGRRARRTQDYRLRRMRTDTLRRNDGAAQTVENAVIDCGWGRLIFADTFADPHRLVETLRAEAADRRDIAFYVRDPHVLLSHSPQELFLDPSHSFRLDLAFYRPARQRRQGFTVRRLSARGDVDAVNTIFHTRGMVPVAPEFFWSARDAQAITCLVAEEGDSGEIVGAVMGVDHARAKPGMTPGSSLWCLAVSPQARQPGVGEALTRRLAEIFKARGCPWMDLSVMHDNEAAIGLYEKLGFRRVPFFSVKRKNPFNEKLFAGHDPGAGLNPYAKLIVNEARRRGIHVKVTDAEGGFFRLTYGGRSIHCRESLSEFTSGVAVAICDDKSVTRRVVEAAGVEVPEQVDASDRAGVEDLLGRAGSLVVKPARGEQGRGITVGVTSMEAFDTAVEAARRVDDTVIVEECVQGDDLRIIVINYRVVACALRRPASVVGDGRKTLRELIESQSKRRQAATGGESHIPIDEETERVLRDLDLSYDDVPEAGREVVVRKTANLHTGGTIHDVTGETHPRLVDAAIRAARAIEIPVVGIDLMVPSPRGPDYRFIEANERPGLANHEPQPTAERFVDLLFPLSMPQAARAAAETVR
ncbi:MAG: N-acetylglutaminylglutamine synthetase [Paracoccaceae bacterium]